MALSLHTSACIVSSVACCHDVLLRPDSVQAGVVRQVCVSACNPDSVFGSTHSTHKGRSGLECQLA